jgi:hypothetical protein
LSTEFGILASEETIDVLHTQVKGMEVAGAAMMAIMVRQASKAKSLTKG